MVFGPGPGTAFAGPRLGLGVGTGRGAGFTFAGPQLGSLPVRTRVRVASQVAKFAMCATLIAPLCSYESDESSGDQLRLSNSDPLPGYSPFAEPTAPSGGAISHCGPEVGGVGGFPVARSPDAI
jgi:hypothetical protein